MQPKPHDKRLYWRGDVLWCRVLGTAGRIVRKTTHCHDELAAVAVANRLERGAADPTYAAASATTLTGCLNRFFEDLTRRKRSKATLAKAKQKVGHFVRLWGAKLPLVRITATLLLEYIDKRQKEGAKDITIKDEYEHLGRALKIAIHLGVFHEQLERIFPPFFSSKHKPKKRWPTPDEMTAVVGQLPSWRAAQLVYIVATGARRGESERALRDDTDWTRRVVHIHGTKTEAADDDIPITTVNEPLLRWALEHAPGSDLLFRPWGKLNRDLAAACVRAEVPKLSPNDLRRGFARWHLLAGVDVQKVSKMLRHTTDKLAQTTYAKATGEEVGVLAGPQIHTLPKVGFLRLQTRDSGVPNLYPESTISTDSDSNEPPETSMKPAPPTRFERVTFALGMRCENPPPNPRSIGNRLVWPRRAGRAPAASVPVAYLWRPENSRENLGGHAVGSRESSAGGALPADTLSDDLREPATLRSPSLFSVRAARASLIDLALRAGITVTP